MHTYVCIYTHVCICIYIYIYTYMADSQIVCTEMVAERKTEESIPYGSNKNRGYTEQKHTPLRAYCVGVCLRVCLPLACVLRLTPLASTAACRRPGKRGCAQSGFQGMLWVCFGYAFLRRYSYTLCGYGAFNLPQTPKHTPKRAKKA